MAEAMMLADPTHEGSRSPSNSSHAGEEGDPRDLQPMPVSCLMQHGVSSTDIERLQQRGIVTLAALDRATTRELCQLKGFSEAKVVKLKEINIKAANSGAFLRAGVFMTGLQVQEVEKTKKHITTGCVAFDQLLGGAGFESQALTELYGEFRTGKTQVCHTVCVTAQLSYENGGGQGKVLYIDTENNFRPERVRSVAERFGLDADGCLENIIRAHVTNTEQQMQAALEAQALIQESGPFSVMIVDSVISLFRTEFSGRGDLAERQQKLGQHLAQLAHIAHENNLAVILINQVTADPGAMSMFGPTVKPVGGNIIAHASTHRIQLKKGRENTRTAKIIDSPQLPEAECQFAITAGGVDDVA